MSSLPNDDSSNTWFDENSQSSAEFYDTNFLANTDFTEDSEIEFIPPLPITPTTPKARPQTPSTKRSYTSSATQMDRALEMQQTSNELLLQIANDTKAIRQLLETVVSKIK